MKDDAGSFTYVLPKNILRAFVTASDLRTQVVAFLYGVSPIDNKQVKEIKAVAWVPQRGSNNNVELPSNLPKDDFLLKDLEPLGWIKTQSLEIPHLSPTDVTTQAKLMAEHPEWGSSSICITTSFTPGSVSLSAHSLTVAGFEWGRKNQDTSANPPGFNPNMSERVQLLLSDRILGMTLVPEGKVWNYGIGLTQMWTPNMGYSMTLDTPLLFWAEEHRPAAFLTVSFNFISSLFKLLMTLCSLPTWNKARTVLMLKIALHKGSSCYLVSLVTSFFLYRKIAYHSAYYMKYTGS